MSKVTGMMAGAALMTCVGAATAGNAPEILGTVDYQAMRPRKCQPSPGRTVTAIHTATEETETPTTTPTFRRLRAAGAWRRKIAPSQSAAMHSQMLLLLSAASTKTVSIGGNNF